MISATIVTFNEADKLKTCLESIHTWVDEIIIVDLGSTDNIKAVARQYSCKLVHHPFVSYVELVRNFAINQCSGDWILVLDPDEYVPPSLQKYLQRYAKTHKTGVLNIPRKNVFFDHWINHTNFWPDYQIRFFRKGTVEWKEVLHSYPTTSLPDTKLPPEEKSALVHSTYPSFRSFIQKQHRYAKIRAQERYLLGESPSLLTMSFAVTREILARYIKHKGFLGGKHGLILTGGLLYYILDAEWQLKKLRSLHRKGQRTA
jgi:glycosyltransferase involved in cell wall biosynthesis